MTFIIAFVIIILVLSIYRGLKAGKEVPFIPANYPYECGPRCLQMIAAYYDKKVEFSELVKMTGMTAEEGTSMLDLNEAAEQLGFKAVGVKTKIISTKQCITELQRFPQPSIAHWQGDYFVVLEKANVNNVTIIYPRKGRKNMSPEDFIENWAVNSTTEEGQFGILLLLEMP